MKKTLFIVPLLFLFIGCEDEQEKDCAGVEGGGTAARWNSGSS